MSQEELVYQVELVNMCLGIEEKALFVANDEEQAKDRAIIHWNEERRNSVSADMVHVVENMSKKVDEARERGFSQL